MLLGSMALASGIWCDVTSHPEAEIKSTGASTNSSPKREGCTRLGRLGPCHVLPRKDDPKWLMIRFIERICCLQQIFFPKLTKMTGNVSLDCGVFFVRSWIIHQSDPTLSTLMPLYHTHTHSHKLRICIFTYVYVTLWLLALNGCVLGL